jgi:putative PIN family toxin of toxin-antitoxin system
VRVVYDTNVLVSALIFPGSVPEVVYRMALEGRVELITTRALLVELARVLTEKFGWDEVRTEQAVAQLARASEVVEPSRRVEVVRDDPADDRVLEAAAEGRADVIVSGDKHLRRLAVWETIVIMDPARFVAEHGG